MAGQFSGNVSWRQAADGIDSSGTVKLTQMRLTLPGRTSIQEDQLNLNLRLAGRPFGPRRIDVGQLDVTAGADKLSARLLRPVQNLAAEPAPVAVQLAGGLDRWMRRAAALAGRPQWRGDGVIDMTAEVEVSTTQLVVKSSALEAKPCQLSGVGLDLDEPRLAADVRGTFDFAQRRWTGGPSTVTSATLAARCDNLLVQLGEPTVISGNVGYSADVSRVCQLLAAADAPPQSVWGGTVQGQAALAQEDGSIRFQLRQRIENASLSQRSSAPGALNQPWRQVWSEPTVEMDATGAWLASEGVLQLDQARVNSASVQLAARGRLSDLASTLQADLEGQMTCDGPKLAQLLRPVAGASLTIQGAGRSDFSVRGPLRSAAPPRTETHLASASPPAARRLAPADLQAAAQLHWEAASIEGVQIGAGTLQTQLEQSVLRFKAIDVPVSGGQIHLAPLVDLTGASPVLKADGRQTFAQLQITPQMCRQWLKYVAPLMADAAQVQGKFSASIDQLSLPVSQPQTGTIGGALTLHSAQVGPGPLSQKLLAVAKQAEAMLKSARDGQTEALAKIKNLDIDTAIETLESGVLFDAQGRFDPRKALGGLLGRPGAPAAPPKKSVWMSVPGTHCRVSITGGASLSSRDADVDRRYGGSHHWVGRP